LHATIVAVTHASHAYRVAFRKAQVHCGSAPGYRRTRSDFETQFRHHQDAFDCYCMKHFCKELLFKKLAAAFRERSASKLVTSRPPPPSCDLPEAGEASGLLNKMSRLFQPLKIGDFEVEHRVMMAPLTRYRCDDEWVPLPMVKGMEK